MFTGMWALLSEQEPRSRWLWTESISEVTFTPCIVSGAKLRPERLMNPPEVTPLVVAQSWRGVPHPHLPADRSTSHHLPRPWGWEPYELWHAGLNSLLRCFKKRDNSFKVIVTKPPWLFPQLSRKHAIVYPFWTRNANMHFPVIASYNWDQSWHWSFLKSWVSSISFLRNLGFRKSPSSSCLPGDLSVISSQQCISIHVYSFDK